MESKDILYILKDLENNNAYKKIFINGKWGIGKSFYTNEYIKNKKDTIYISLFGKDNIEAIQEEISKELFKIINLKKKILKKFKETIKNLNASISYFGISINSPEIKTKSFIEEYSSILEEDENLIIVIDDLERKSRKIAIEDILGIIEQLSLFEKIKIVLIGDDSKIEGDDKEIWEKFKEKIIEKEYNISKFSKESIFSLLNSKVNEYIEEKELKKFIEEFIEKIPISNLRTINKGINLFLEISNTHLNNNFKNTPKINLIILKSCMAVAIEKTENIYEPKELTESEKKDYYKQFEVNLDKNIEKRIERHYFNSYIIMNKEAFLVHYVLKIFEGDYTKNLIDEMKQLINEFLNQKEEKDIFYLSEDKIKETVSAKYNSILGNKYKYTCLDGLIDDLYNIIYWFDIFKLEYDEKELKKKFEEIVNTNYYNTDKELHENTIDRFSFRYENCKELEKYINEYNQKAKERYYTQKLNEVEESYRTKKFEVIKIRWIEIAFIQLDKKIQFERFILKARDNNYFMSDLTGEISHEEWMWNHYVWNIFYEYMPKEYKLEFKNYIDTLKGINKLQDVRIDALQKNKPLI